MSTNKKPIKVILVGEFGVGKTAFIRKCTNGNFVDNYVSTIGVELYTFLFNATQVQIWDTGAHPDYVGLGDGYYIGSEHAIVMIQPFTPQTKIKRWCKDITNVCGNIPITILCNKCDIAGNNVNIINNNLKYKKINISTRAETQVRLLGILKSIICQSDSLTN